MAKGQPFDPTQVPAELWDDREVQEALVRRKLGRFFVLYCRQTGASQTDIATLIGRSQPAVSRLIHDGRTVMKLELLTDVAEGLAMPDRARMLMGLTPAGVLVGRAAEVSAGLGPIPPGPRPAFLPEVAQQLAPALLALGPPGGSSAAPDLAFIEAGVRQAWELRQQAQYTALGTLLAGLLPAAEQTAAQIEGDERVQAVRALAHGFNATSSLLKKLGDYGLALVAADRAVQAARSLEDPLLLAAAAHRLVNVLLPAGRLVETQDVALAAADAIDPAKLSSERGHGMWGALLLTAAVASARRGDEPTAWELMGEARTASRLLGQDQADLFAIFGPTNVAVHGVQVAVELGRGRDAVRRAGRVNVDQLPAGLVERRAQFLIDLAVGHALERDDVGAVATLTRAEEIAPEEVHYSRAVVDTVWTMLGRERKGATPGLRELAGRLGVA